MSCDSSTKIPCGFPVGFPVFGIRVSADFPLFMDAVECCAQSITALTVHRTAVTSE